MPKSTAAHTAGQLRDLLEGVPAETPIYPDWPRGHKPHKHDPGVELLGIRLKTDRRGKLYLSAVVKLFAPGDE